MGEEERKLQTRSLLEIRPEAAKRDVLRHDVAGACFGVNWDFYLGKCPYVE